MIILQKAKYLKRWKGKDGKWNYKYATKTGKKNVLDSFETKKVDEFVQSRKEQHKITLKRATDKPTNKIIKRILLRQIVIIDNAIKLAEAVKHGEIRFHDPKSEKGDSAIIHPSSREGWKWQVSYFDEQGPFHHDNGNDLSEILTAIERMGNFIPGKPSKGLLKSKTIRKSRIMLKAKKDLNYWKKKLLSVLKGDVIEKSLHEILYPGTMLKALSTDVQDMLQKARGFAVGTIRTWGGKDYKKLTSGKWMRTYTGTGERGERQAVRNVMRAIQGASTIEELARIIDKNMQRFKDEAGKTLPIVKEFMTAARGTEGGKKDTSKEPLTSKEKLKAQIKTAEKELGKKWSEMTDAEQDKYVDLLSDSESGKKIAKKELVKNGKQKKYIYGMNLRPAGGGALPEGFKVESGKSDDFGHGTVSYDRKLTDEELDKFDMTATGEDHLQNITNRIVSKMGKYASKYLEEPEYLEGMINEELAGKYSNKIPKSDYNKLVDMIKDSISSKKEIKGIDKIRDKYQKSDKVSGDEDTIYVGKEEISGQWKMVEADSPTASHDETNFNRTKGFPSNPDGSTINDRDYGKDKAAQEIVNSIASEFDGRALSFDSPVVVTNDGVVVSGNNRTMSSKIAARKGTDKKYIIALEKRAKKFGFTSDDIKKFKNPRVVFEIDKGEGYSTEQFAKFNVKEIKAMSPIENAVKMSKIINIKTIKGIGEKIQEFDTLGELYADKRASMEIYNTLESGGIITEFNRPQYITEDGITGAGKEFLETVMVGSVVSEKNIRALNKAKSVRKKLVRAISQLVQNKSMGGYSISDEMNQAIDVVLQVKASGDKFKSVEDFAKQSNMFEEKNDVAIELAKKLELKEKDFADFMQKMNANLGESSSGQSDMFFGDVETKDQVLNRMLNLKKAILDGIKSRILVRKR